MLYQLSYKGSQTDLDPPGLYPSGASPTDPLLRMQGQSKLAGAESAGLSIKCRGGTPP